MAKRLKRRCESGRDNRLVCCGFRRTDKAMLVEDMSKSECLFFPPRFDYRKFCVLYPFVTYLLTLPRSFSFLGVEVRMSPLGTSTTTWPIVTDSDDR
jgi:hypothetical protein